MTLFPSPAEAKVQCQTALVAIGWKVW